MYYFYILQSEIDHQYYYGSTTNLKRRAKEHSKGAVFATKYRRPLRLVYYEAFLSLDQARKREKQVKLSGSIRDALNKRISPVGPARPPAGKPGQ